MPGSPSLLFSLCQVSPSGLCYITLSFLPSLPFWTSLPCYGHMPNTIAQAVFLICWCELWFHYFAQLTFPLACLLQFPIYYNTKFCHLLSTSVILHILFIPCWGLFWSFLPYAIIGSRIFQLSLIFITPLTVLISTYSRELPPCTCSCLFNYNLTRNKTTFYFLLHKELSSTNLSLLFYLWPQSFLTLERTLQVIDSHVNNTVTKQMKTSSEHFSGEVTN